MMLDLYCKTIVVGGVFADQLLSGLMTLYRNSTDFASSLIKNAIDIDTLSYGSTQIKHLLEGTAASRVVEVKLNRIKLQE